MGKTGYVFRLCLPNHIVCRRGNLDIINLGALPSTGGAAFLQTSKGSIFDPFTSGVLLQLRHLSSFLYIIYTASFT